MEQGYYLFSLESRGHSESCQDDGQIPIACHAVLSISPTVSVETYIVRIKTLMTRRETKKKKKKEEDRTRTRDLETKTSYSHPLTPLTPSPPHPLTPSPPHSLTPSLPHSLTPSLPHSLSPPSSLLPPRSSLLPNRYGWGSTL